VPEYLSPAWFEAADAALRADTGLAAAGRGIHLVLQQTVDDPAPGTTWHIRVVDGAVSLLVGAADDATVTFHCDRSTALDVHRGRTSAQAAFMSGRLRVGGNLAVLASSLGDLDAVADHLAGVREQTGPPA